MFVGMCLYMIPVASMNLLLPYETLLRPKYDNKDKAQFFFQVETGFADTAFGEDGRVPSVLNIYQCEQDALEMLDGFCDTSVIGQKRIQLDAQDDGVRGHFKVCGDFHLKLAATFNARFFFADDWALGIYLPFYSMALNNVAWLDQTRNVTDADIRVHEFLTDNFFANVKSLGKCLELGDWNRSGLGDLTVFAEWFHDFQQYKPLLKNVRLNWRVGLLFPTGKRTDEDKIMAIPFGYDGAFGIPFGVGLDINLAHYLNVGLDVQLTHIFGNTRSRRIRTAFTQTELLLLEKVQAYKEFGLTQKFNLYAETTFRGFSGLLAYQYMKHGDDTLRPTVDCYNFQVINSAEHLQEWTIHQMITNFNYDFGYLYEDARVRPQVALFARLPFNGKRAITVSTVGAMISFDF